MKAILAGAVLLATAATTAAQPAATDDCPKPALTFQDHWCGPLRTIYERLRTTGGPLAGQGEIERLIRLQGANLRAFLLYAQSRSEALDVRLLEDSRIDKQVGAPATTGGSGSVVSKGAVPSILGFAVENGALMQSATDTTITLRGNLVGWLDLIQNQGFIASYEDDSPIVRQLRRLSYSLHLNTTAATVAPNDGGGFSPDAIRDYLDSAGQQLAAYSIRFALWDQRDPRRSSNRAAVATMVDESGGAVLRANNFMNDVLSSPEYNFKWIPETATLLNNPALSRRDLERVLYRQLEQIRLLMVNRIDNFDEQVANALLALEGFDSVRLKVFQAMQKRPLIAVEYVAERAHELPDKSTVRFIAEGQWGPRLDLTANVAWTFQGSGTVEQPTLTEIEGVRDFQVAAQLEVPLASAATSLEASGIAIGTPVLGVAYLSQKLTEGAAVSFAGSTFAVDPGWIHVVQARLLLPVKGTGVKIPLSLSLANRTEILSEKTVRGHIGVTFDLDVLSSLRR